MRRVFEQLSSSIGWQAMLLRIQQKSDASGISVVRRLMLWFWSGMKLKSQYTSSS